MADITNQLQAAAGAAGGPTGGSYLITGGSGKTIQLFDHTTPGTLTSAATYTQGQNIVYGVCFSPDGAYAAAGGAFSAAQVTLLTRTTPSSLTFAATYNCAGAYVGQNALKFSPDSNYIVAGTNDSNAEITLLNHTTPGTLSLSTTYNTNGTGGATYSTDFSSDGDYIVVGGSAPGGGNPQIFLLNHTTPGSLSLSTTYTVGNSNAFNCVFSPDDTYIACSILRDSGGANVSFVLLNHSTPGSLSLATTYATSNPGGSAIYGCSWSPNGSYIATGGFVTVSGQNICIVTLLSHTAGTVSLAATYQVGDSASGNGSQYTEFSPDGKYIAANGRTSGGNTGNTAVVLLNHSAGVLSLATTYDTGAAARYSAAWSPD